MMGQIMVEPLATANAVSIELTSDLADVARARDFSRDVCDVCWPSVDEDQFNLLQLAMSEAITNVIEHAYEFVDDKSITILAGRVANYIQIDIQHDGHPFSPPDEVPQIDEPLEGGMGLFLMEQCFDQITYGRTESGRQCMFLQVNTS